MNATLMQRPLMELLLQPFSTATTQTKNNTIAAVLRVFSNMIDSSRVPRSINGSSKEYCRKIVEGTVTPITRDRDPLAPRLKVHSPRSAKLASVDI
jgi:hypothetical protein